MFAIAHLHVPAELEVVDAYLSGYFNKDVSVQGTKYRAQAFFKIIFL